MFKFMAKHRFINVTSIAFGFSIGVLLAFFIAVLVFQKAVFEKPWDIFWAGLFAVGGSLVGSAVGGLFAFYIAKIQIAEQADKEEQKEKNQQQILANLIFAELINNKQCLSNITERIPTDETCQKIAVAMVDGRKDVFEALMLTLDNLELDYVTQLRTSLTDLRYLNLHRLIQEYIQIQRIGNRVMELEDKRFVQASLVTLRKKCLRLIQMIQQFEKQNST